MIGYFWCECGLWMEVVADGDALCECGRKYRVRVVGKYIECWSID